jgi:hypothetical protein
MISHAAARGDEVAGEVSMLVTGSWLWERRKKSGKQSSEAASVEMGMG